MDYISCAPTTLYREGGFFESPDLLTLLSDTARTTQDECRLIGELYPPYSYTRPVAEFYTENAGFRVALERHYAHVDRAFAQGAACAVVCLTSAFLNQNVIYMQSASGIRTVFETYRSVDRPYVPHVDPLVSPSPIEALSDPTVLNLFLGSAGSSNYGHWLVDDLPRAYAVKLLQSEAAGRPVRIWITSASPIIDRVRTESLQQFCSGLGEIQVGLLRPNQVYAFRDLYYATPVTRHPALKSPDAMAVLRDRATTLGASVGARLFVTRRANYPRGLLNIEEIQRHLEQHGFVAVDVETMSFLQQMQAFAGVDLVVGCMGAAMTNCVFAPVGTTTLYLAPEGWVEPFYWDAAAVLGHRYLACYGPVSDSTRDAHLSDYSIDAAALEVMLKKVLAAPLEVKE